MLIPKCITAAALLPVIAGYSLRRDYFDGGSGNFFNNFLFENIPDPTNGYVEYVASGTAMNGYGAQPPLVNTNNNQVYIGVDYTSSGAPRRSVRIKSNDDYDVGTLMVLDLAHMPGGICGTWPAFWTLADTASYSWPNGGEIDILEGVNGDTVNQGTLHTNAGCSMPGRSGSNSVKAGVDQCYDNGNSGCALRSNDNRSYGQQFNAQGGGTYAMEFTNNAITMWFWPRGQAPGDALGANPNPRAWANPYAYFPSSSSCNVGQHFLAQKIILDNTFCGAWAGATWGPGDSCYAAHGGTCQDFVSNNPAAFKDAYWLINALKVYSGQATYKRSEPRRHLHDHAVGAHA